MPIKKFTGIFGGKFHSPDVSVSPDLLDLEHHLDKQTDTEYKRVQAERMYQEKIHEYNSLDDYFKTETHSLHNLMGYGGLWFDQSPPKKQRRSNDTLQFLAGMLEEEDTLEMVRLLSINYFQEKGRMKRERDEEILLCCKNDLPLDEDDYKINRNKYLPDLILAVECLKEAGLGKRHRNFADKILQEHQFYQQGKKRKPEFLDVWIESCQSK